MKNIYLPGLNSLRAIAAFVVLLYHFDICFSTPMGLNLFRIYQTNIQASLAVTLFFVLSGYLITHLLLVEKGKSKTINVSAFYARRILRIWPLYYLIIIGTFLLNLVFYGSNIFSTDRSVSLLYLFFCGNFVEPFYLFAISNLTILSPLYVLWSLAVEEQFYLIWPWIIRFSSKLIFVLSAFVFGYLLLKLVVQAKLPEQYLLLLNLTRLDCMAIGAIGAIFIQSPDSNVKWILQNVLFSPVVQIVSWLVFVSAFTHPLHVFSFIDSEIYSVAFVIAILNLSKNTRSIIKLENKVFNFLGQISYGIYMYHTLLMTLLVQILPVPNRNVFNYFLWLITISVLVVILAYLSNRYFEDYFIRLKKRFEIVHSSNRAKAKQLQTEAALSRDFESL